MSGISQSIEQVDLERKVLKVFDKIDVPVVWNTIVTYFRNT